MLTHEHVVTRTVRDSAAILDCTAGAMPGDPYTAPPPSRPFADEVGADPGPLRIGWRTAMPGGDAPDPECVTAVERTVAALESLGHHVEVAPFPSSTPCRLPQPASSAPSWRDLIGGASATASRSPKPMSSRPRGSSR
jgi:amidase